MNKLAERFIHYDISLFHYLNQKIRCKPLDLLLPKLTHLGGAFFSLTALAIMLIFPALAEPKVSLAALASLTVSHIIVHFIKKKYCRARPYHAISNVNLISTPLKDYSFPSGHSTASFSIAATISLFIPLLSIILLPLAAAVAVSRMYLGLHYPSDCMTGALIGCFTAIPFFIVFS